ncbi:MAG: hypothetical protein GX643_18585 [Acidimicrobiales bacterium]|nr:hypothetical protein [Acidimicrobiales bacterium]
MSVRGGVQRLMVVLAVAVASLTACEPPPPRVGLEVTTTDGGPDASPGDGACADADGACSLAAAFEEASALGGADLSVPAGEYWYSGTITGDIRVNPDVASDVDARLHVVVEGHLSLNGVDATSSWIHVEGSLHAVRSKIQGDWSGVPLYVAPGAGVFIEDSILAGHGAALVNDGTAVAFGSTLYASGPDGVALAAGSDAATHLRSSVVAGAAGTGTCTGRPPVSHGFTHVEVPCGDLGAEGDSTGPALLWVNDQPNSPLGITVASDSPLVDAIPVGHPACRATDVFGSPRGADGDGDGLPGCDVGALERPPAQAGPGSISGAVTRDSDASPVAGVVVSLGPWGPQATTGVDGTYTISGVEPGQHIVHFDGVAPLVGEYYGDSLTWAGAQPVAVGVGELVDGIDAGLALGGSIEGRVVRLDDGAPLSDVVVTAELVGSTASTTVLSGPDGRYQLQGLPAGEHNVFFEKPGVSGRRFYDNPYVPTAVPVTAGEVVVLGDFSLQTVAPLSGRVTAQGSGEPLAGIRVEAWQWDGFEADVFTGADGTFSFPGLPTYSYYVVFHPPEGNPQNLVAQYWGGSWGLAGASLVDLGWDGRSDVDASMATGGSISGQVTRADDSSPVPFADLEVDPDVWGPARVATDADGRYEIRGVPVGEHVLRVQALDRPDLVTATVAVTVAEGMETVVDVAMDSPGVSPGVTPGAPAEDLVGAAPVD